jgi:hypothetical protein
VDGDLNKNKTINYVEKHNFCSESNPECKFSRILPWIEGRQLSNVRSEYNTYPGAKEVENSA